LSEMVVDVGPGYRVYYAEFGKTTIVLVLGGPKSTQASDMKKAGKMLAEMKQKHQAAQRKREEQEAEEAAQHDSRGKTKSKGK